MTREELYAELKERHAQVNWNDLQSIKGYNEYARALRRLMEWNDKQKGEQE